MNVGHLCCSVQLRRNSVGKTLYRTSSDLEDSSHRGAYSSLDALVVYCTFFMSRKGAQFVEVWLDGFAFSELSQKQEAIASHREELERQRKQLTKRKPPSSSQGQGGSGAGGKASRGGKQSTPGAATVSDEGFTKPTALVSLTPQEYMEKDELLKLRAALLKKVVYMNMLLSNHL